MKTGSKVIIIVDAVLVVAVVAVLGLRPFFVQRDGIHYVTRPVRFADISATVSETGTVNPINTVLVGSEVSGTITSLGVDYNSRVKRQKEGWRSSTGTSAGAEEPVHSILRRRKGSRSV
jgi:HlyD family secretion protein